MAPRVLPGEMATPGLGRRLACFFYEGVLLFGVLMAAGLLYGVATQQRSALTGMAGLRVFLFLVLGVYFVGFWSRTGQTLAMQTWHMRLVTTAGEPVSPWRALGRYLLAWMWFLPALITLQWAGLKGLWPTSVALASGVLAYAALTWLHPERQYWHDAVCKTRLTRWVKPARGARK
jgi:uncharacterized RDD family membrane protein YckC